MARMFIIVLVSSNLVLADGAGSVGAQPLFGAGLVKAVPAGQRLALLARCKVFEANVALSAVYRQLARHIVQRDHG